MSSCLDPAPEKGRTPLRRLLTEQSLAVLSTCGDGRPYASLVGFAHDATLSRLFFATARDTRKYANLQACPHAALLVDSRTHRAEDFQEASAVTAVGPVRELRDGERAEAVTIFLARHPQLAGFLAGDDCALLAMDVASFLLVARFQEVTEIRPPVAP